MLNHPKTLFYKIKEFTICKIKGHDLIPAGSCPFTGTTYMYCKSCSNLVPMEVLD